LRKFWPLAGVAILSFLLNQLQYRGDSDTSHATRGTTGKQNAPNKSSDEIDKLGHCRVADAIHAYREFRETHERDNASRDRKTLRALVATAIFSLVAAVIFAGQLQEMRADSRLTERAFVNIKELNSRELKRFPRQNIPDDVLWEFGSVFENTGKTPAVNVRIMAVTPQMEPEYYEIVDTPRQSYELNMHPKSKRELDIHSPSDPDVIFSWSEEKSRPFL
jgi:hypothetical protein